MRRRILLLVVGMTTLVVLAFAIPLVVLVRNNAYDDGTSGLRGEANELARFLRETNVSKTEAQINVELAGLNKKRAASVTLPGGRTLGRLPPGGLTGVPAPPRFGDRGAAGSSIASATSTAPTTSAGASRYPGAPNGPGGGGGGNDVMTQPFRGGQIVQLTVLPFASLGQGNPNPSTVSAFYIVRVYADDATLRAGQTRPLLELVGIAVALLIVGVVAGEILTRRIVRPLVDTSETAQRLAAGDVTARATTSGPAEVADVGRALNRLADRIDQLIAEERETVADLSHRLRTPMTALRLDAEALNDHGEAERIGTHVTALERMLTAVIRAARRPQREGRMPSCEAVAVVGERVEFWSALAEDQGRDVTVSLPDAPVTVRAGDEDLGAAVDALLENVIAHTPEGTAFGVRLVAVEGGAELTIGDDGPGLPDDAAVRGRSDRGSTGLGLDIARRCAESSGGSMTLGSTVAGGALVTLVLRSG